MGRKRLLSANDRKMLELVRLDPTIYRCFGTRRTFILTIGKRYKKFNGITMGMFNYSLAFTKIILILHKKNRDICIFIYVMCLGKPCGQVSAQLDKIHLVRLTEVTGNLTSTRTRKAARVLMTSLKIEKTNGGPLLFVIVISQER